MQLQRDLLLFEFLTDRLGGDFAALSTTLKNTDAGRRADGQSHWFGCLEGRASRLLETSGLPAWHALSAGAGYAGIQVLEITKLYKPQPGQSGPRSGESLPTDHFEGPNLLLVDEGHKGTASAGDAAEERAWRTVQEALAENGGFTIEYSATFAQVAEIDPILHAEYARSIVFDYAYRSFYADGYGKDYWVANLQDQPGGTHEDLLLMGGLLAFYQQWRCFHDERAALRPYLIEPPLMVFIGDKVSAGKAPEVLEVIRFLDRVSGDERWAEGVAARVLSGNSGLHRPPDGADCCADRFPYLRGQTRAGPTRRRPSAGPVPRRGRLESAPDPPRGG